MDTNFARRQMIEQQIRTWNIHDDDVLEAFGGVPRDQFVPKHCVDVAYADTEIPLSHGQCMLRPSIVGKILQAIDLAPDHEVLEVGTGSGYLTACMAHLAGSVTSIDIYDDLIAAAEMNLAAAGVENVTLECMDAMSELPEGPYDAITMTSSAPEFHEAYGELLKPGGRLFMFVGDSAVKTAILVTRTADDKFEIDELFESDVPALVSSGLPREFSF